MLNNISSKKKILISSAILLIFLVAIALIYLQRLDRAKYSNLSSMQQSIISNFSSQKGYDVTYSSDNSKLSGNLVTPSSFQGTYQVLSQDKDGKDTPSNKYTLTKVGEETFVKKEEETSYKKEDKMFAYELNVLTHPDWLQLQKRLDDQKIDGITYLQYEVIFEKPDQEIVKTMSPEQLDGLRIFGTILVDKQTFQLKQLKFRQGKEGENQSAVDYAINENPPKIDISTNLKTE